MHLRSSRHPVPQDPTVIFAPRNVLRKETWNSTLGNDIEPTTAPNFGLVDRIIGPKLVALVGSHAWVHLQEES